MWFDIPMHDALAMAEVKSLEEFENIIPDIIVDEARIESAEVGIVDIFKYETGSFALIIPNNIKEGDDIRSTRQILKNFDFTLYLLLFHRLQNLDNAFLVVDDVDTLENFRVLSSTYKQVC